MKKVVIFILLSFSFFAHSGELRSAQQLVSFNCTLSSAMGVTQLFFNKESENRKISGKRNGFIPVSYQLESSGRYGTSQKSHITMSGGSLARNQYISLIFNSILPTGQIRASGAIILATMGGSVFAPVLQSSLPVGTVNCATIVIK